MSYFINLETKEYPLTEQQIKELYPNTSFATPFSPPENFAWVAPTPQIEHNNILQNCIEDTPELTSKGIWQQKWKLVDKFFDIVTYAGENGTIISSKQEQEQQAIENNNELLKQRIAGQAKEFLKEVDWTQYTDVALVLSNLEEFNTYRSTLRSYIINPPTQIESWPVKPTAIWK